VHNNNPILTRTKNFHIRWPLGIWFRWGELYSILFTISFYHPSHVTLRTEQTDSTLIYYTEGRLPMNQPVSRKLHCLQLRWKQDYLRPYPPSFIAHVTVSGSGANWLRFYGTRANKLNKATAEHYASTVFTLANKTTSFTWRFWNFFKRWIIGWNVTRELRTEPLNRSIKLNGKVLIFFVIYSHSSTDASIWHLVEF